MVDGKHALVVVACIAGFGAWATAKVTVVNGDTIYASELFGAGHSSPEYPLSKTPMVVLTIPANAAAAAGPPAVKEVNHSGSADITFTLTGGAVFDANVTGLMWDMDTTDDAGPVAAPGSVASIKEGGRKGDRSITITVMEGAEDGRPTRNLSDNLGTPHTISFTMPRLANLGALAGANPKAPSKSISLNATSRIVSGAFRDGPLTGVAPHFVESVINARDSLTVTIEPSGTNGAMKTIAIDDNDAMGLSAFKSVKEKNKDGYVELATVTIKTKQESSPAMTAVKREDLYWIKNDVGATDDPVLVDGDDSTAGVQDDDGADDVIYRRARGPVGASYYPIYDLDGEMITAEGEGLRGTFSVSAMGTRDLFNDGDMLFVDYDKNGKMGTGEAIEIDGSMAMGDSLSIDADKSDSFDKDGTGSFKVFYMPGGKDAINHGSMIHLTAMVDYSDPSAIDEAAKKTSTTLNFDGVGNPVMAYAIPHSTNGIGDKGNVRVRCEASMGCRVFLECWDDMGMRGFGEAPAIAGNSVMVWSGEAIEGVTGMEPTSRHSCRVLSKGMVTVQQLTRDGNSGTLVNNTYVGGSM